MEEISNTRATAGSPNPLQAGARLQEFVIERVIGIGGFGIVYQARDTLLHRTVAIKEYMPTSMASRTDGLTVSLRSESYSQDFEVGKISFINEARMLARFKHPALIEVFRFWEQNCTAYLATPFYEGRTLKENLRASPDLPSETDLRDILMPVLEALQHMHREQIYHRDVSPDNIMILNDGKPVLLDLGAARQVESENAQAHTVLVKPGYAPIEQYAGDAGTQQGPWTDVYGWGATAYFALTGKPPPPAASRIMRDSIIKLADLKPEGYSSSFLSAIDLSLAVRPDDRPQSMVELRQLLASKHQPEASTKSRIDRLDQALEGLASLPDPTLEITTKIGQAKFIRSIAVERVSPQNSTFPKASSTEATSQSVSEVLSPPSSQSAAQTFGATTPRQAVSARLKNAPRTTVLSLVAIAVFGLLALLLWIAQPTEKVPAARNEPPKTLTQKTEPSTGQAAQVAAPRVDASKVEASKQGPSQPDAAKIEAPSQQASKPELLPVEGPKADPATPAELVLNKPAIARLVIKPWGEIFVNGQSRGVSPPLKNLSLEPGEYKIEIRNGDYPGYKLRIKLKSGEVYKINHTFTDPAQK